jgi:hypothetical protein
LLRFGIAKDDNREVFLRIVAKVCDEALDTPCMADEALTIFLLDHHAETEVISIGRQHSLQ